MVDEDSLKGRRQGGGGWCPGELQVGVEGSSGGGGVGGPGELLEHRQENTGRKVGPVLVAWERG